MPTLKMSPSPKLSNCSTEHVNKDKNMNKSRMSDSDWSTDSEAESDSEVPLDLTAPKAIKLEVPVFDAKFHPEECLVVAGDLEGRIQAWRIDEECR